MGFASRVGVVLPCNASGNVGELSVNPTLPLRWVPSVGLEIISHFDCTIFGHQERVTAWERVVCIKFLPLGLRATGHDNSWLGPSRATVCGPKVIDGTRRILEVESDARCLAPSNHSDFVTGGDSGDNPRCVPHVSGFPCAKDELTGKVTPVDLNFLLVENGCADRGHACCAFGIEVAF